MDIDLKLSDTRAATEALRRESVDVYNRLHSIDEDAGFVSTVADAYRGYLLLRLWRLYLYERKLTVMQPTYDVVHGIQTRGKRVNPHFDKRRSSRLKTSNQPVYFKSTDGHHGNWAFNLRRTNLHLLTLVEEHGGVLLVDSTRRGKRIPDALSKTIPLWCAVVNAAIAQKHGRGEGWRETGQLYTPPASVSTSEHAQMAARITEFAGDLLASQYTLPALNKPLRPFWVTPSTTVLLDHVTASYYPVICVSASKAVADGIDRRAGYVYVQGSGDDHELWSQGLTPEIYWQHRDTLLSAGREELQQRITSLVAQGNSNLISPAAPASVVRQTGGRLWVTDLLSIPAELSVVRLGGEDSTSPHSLTLPVLHDGKKGQFYFMNSLLPLGVAFIGSELDLGRDVCVACSNGRDMSVGVALAALQLFFDDQGKYTTKPCTASKENIRMRLQWILESRPSANPSRTTLKRVHEFLMSPSTRVHRNLPLSHGLLGTQGWMATKKYEGFVSDLAP